MLRFIDILGFTIERLREHKLLVFWVIVGLSCATTLALSLVLYVDAVNTNLLSSKLSNPPYAFRFRYLGSWEGNITPQDVDAATAAIQQGFKSTIGLPTSHEIRFLRSTPWRVTLMRADETSMALRPADMAVLEGVEKQIRITAGQWPPTEEPDDDSIPVLISEAMLFEMGLQVGDTLTVQNGETTLTLEIAALWQPNNANDPTWIFTPRFFNELMLVREDDFWDALADLDTPIGEAAWYLIFNGQSLRTSDIPAVLSAIADGERDVNNILPGIRMESPRDGLRLFVNDVNQLTQQLVIIVLPVAGLILYFVSLVAGLLVTRQQGEDVVLRSRGMSRRLLLSVHVLMWLILAGSALGIGALLSPYVVRLVSRTSSFLQFRGVLEQLDIVFTNQAIVVGVFTAMMAASSGLVMAWRSTGQTINSYKRQAARSTKAWWQRMYLDLMLLVPGSYVLYTLWQQGGLQTEADNPFGDPLTFVGPTLFALGLTLLFLRLWPLLLRIGDRVISFTSNIALLMALRELTRSIGRYRGTLLMMCFTLSLTGLTASMASTIDRSLADSVDYEVGADAVMITVADAQTEEGETTDSGQTTYTVTGFNVLPIDDLFQVEGISSVSRVGRYDARLVQRNQRLNGKILGIDRAAMASIVRFREDFSDSHPADLFNLLATNRSGVIISEKTMIDLNLLMGQEIDIEVSALGQWYPTRVPVLGVVEYFPTLNPTDGFFLITNIDPLFELVGTELPHDVWVSLDAGADLEQVKQAVRELNFPVLEWRDPTTTLQQAQADPSRRGVLGFLSVGFVASVLLTLVAAIIQNTGSFRAQALQLGSLRAMGLGGLSASAYLLLLQGIAASSGILGGTTIGVATTLLFLPLLDFSGGLPPYLVRVAWDEIIVVYAVFAGVLFFVTVLTTIMASLQQLSSVVKLGDV